MHPTERSVGMNTTHTAHDPRLNQLARWRMATLLLLTLLAGLLIGGMSSAGRSGSPVVGVTGLDGKIYRVHEDGSITYVRVDDYFKTARGAFSWGQFNLDPRYTNEALPPRLP